MRKPGSRQREGGSSECFSTWHHPAFFISIYYRKTIINCRVNVNGQNAMRLSSSRHRGSRQRAVHALPIAVGVSVLVHAAGIGVPILLRPVPYPPAALETIEIALVTERAHGKAGTNDGSGSATKSDGPAGVSPAALAPSTPVTALPPQRSVGASISLGAGTTHAFDLPKSAGTAIAAANYRPRCARCRRRLSHGERLHREACAMLVGSIRRSAGLRSNDDLVSHQCTTAGQGRKGER